MRTSNGNVQRSKEILVVDLKRVIGDAEDLMREVANSTAEEFAAARNRIEAKLSEARFMIDEARIVVTKKACGAADAAHEYINENPWKVVGVASLVGLVAAILLSRRPAR